MGEAERDGLLEAKVTALLAISVDLYLRETGVAKPRPRSIDKMLLDTGLPAKEIAAVLGKTEQAVYAVLQTEKKKRTSAGRKPSSPGSTRVQSGGVGDGSS